MTELKPLSPELREAFRILSAPRRCYVIAALRGVPTQRSARELARTIAGIEAESPYTAVSETPYRSVYNGLTQTHLPSMAAVGVIEYEENRKVVSQGPRYHLINRILTISRGISRTVDLETAIVARQKNTHE